MTVSSQITRTRTQFEAANESVPYRIVGSHEYGNAIESFEQLAERSTQEEIEVYDKLIREKPEFSYYSGVATTLGLAQHVSSSDEEQRMEFDQEYRKSSLAWLLALARVELGSTISLYGKSDTPFEQVVSSQFGTREFVQVLQDDLVAHLKAVPREPGFQRSLNRQQPTDSGTLAYLRRITLIYDMLQQVVKSSDAETAAAARPYEKEVGEYANQIVTKIEHGSLSQYRGKDIRFVDREQLSGCQRRLESKFTSAASSKFERRFSRGRNSDSDR